MRKKTIIAIALVAVLVPSVFGQVENSSFKLTRYMPPGALAFAEVDDLAARLGSVVNTEWQDRFTNSKVFKDFTVSKLYNKLADRIRALEEATGFGLNPENFKAMAGGRSALALYDIGELRLLFISEMPMEKIAASALWNLRDRFEQRGEADDRYWVKEDPYGRVALAFTFVRGHVLVGTDVVRFEQARELLRDEGDSLANDERFTAALPTEIPESNVTVYLDQERIAATPYWRSYWIYDNQSDLADVRSAVLAMNIGDDEIVETRWLQRDSIPHTATGLVELAKVMPGPALYYEYGSADDEKTRDLLGDLLGGAVKENLDNLAASFQQGFRRTYGLAVDISGTAGEFDLGFTKVAAFDGANSAGFDTVQFEKTVVDIYSEQLLPKGAAALKFIDRNGIRVLDLPLFEGGAPAYRVDGSVVFISNNAAALTPAEGDGPGLPENLAAQSGITTAMWLNVDSISEKLGDFLSPLSKRGGWRPSYNAAFFNENIISLMSLFESLESMSLVRTVDGNKVLETVIYKLER